MAAAIQLFSNIWRHQHTARWAVRKHSIAWRGVSRNKLRLLPPGEEPVVLALDVRMSESGKGEITMLRFNEFD